MLCYLQMVVGGVVGFQTVKTAVLLLLKIFDACLRSIPIVKVVVGLDRTGVVEPVETGGGTEVPISTRVVVLL